MPVTQHAVGQPVDKRLKRKIGLKTPMYKFPVATRRAKDARCFVTGAGVYAHSISSIARFVDAMFWRVLGWSHALFGHDIRD